MGGYERGEAVEAANTFMEVFRSLRKWRIGCCWYGVKGWWREGCFLRLSPCCEWQLFVAAVGLLLGCGQFWWHTRALIDPVIGLVRVGVARPNSNLTTPSCLRSAAHENGVWP